MQEAEVEHHGPSVCLKLRALSPAPHNEAKVGAFCFQQAASIVANNLRAPRRCRNNASERPLFASNLVALDRSHNSRAN